MKRKYIFTGTLLVLLSSGMIARAQIPVPPPAPAGQPRSSAELDQMLGAIALYPDPLIAQILPAATLPPQIVLADRYVNGGGDLNLIDQQPWDASVKALARYPTVLKWMDDNLAWTTSVGQAFLYQAQDVMDSIQRLRAEAQALGNLQSTPQENVISDDGTIEILPADPQVIYVPEYQPDMVYGQRPDGRPFIAFGAGMAVGAWLDHDFDWRNHNLIVWRHDQPRPADWWSHRPSERPPPGVNQATVWQPRNPAGPAASGMDRGYYSRPGQSAVTVIGTGGPPTTYGGTPAGPVRSTVTVIGGQPRPAAPRGTPAPPVGRPESVVVQHPAAAPRSPPANGALIGIQSSHQTQQFSNRGQESRQTTISKPAAPAAHSAPPAHSEAPSRPVAPGRR
jgi:hypothetical protein